jgi:CRP-like cAMP-binding protein
MIVHPKDIANEIKKYPFFALWQENLLLQVAMLMKTKQVPAGMYILKNGQVNNQLFFLRSGAVDVYFNGEVVSRLNRPGEVMGEMSVITQNEVTSNLLTTSEVSLFVLSIPDFQHIYPVEQREKVEFLFYKIFTAVLVERLLKANEKVRLFEILNRELSSAQSILGANTGNKKIFLIEADQKQLIITKMAVAGAGLSIEAVCDEKLGQELVNTSNFDLYICEEGYPVFLENLHKSKPDKPLLVFSSQGVRDNIQILENLGFVDYFISKDSIDRNVSIHNVLISLNKIFTKDIFKLEKYLSWGAQVKEIKITGSRQRHDARSEMLEDLKQKGIRSALLTQVNTVSEEMLMNAVYDAPTDEHGKVLFNHQDRTIPIELLPHQQSKLRYATDGVTLAISVSDPFGSLHKSVILKYLKSCYENQDNAMTENKGGAGKGLHQIVENSNLTIFNIKKKNQTEVISLFYLDPLRRAVRPTFHYFFID